MTLPLYGGITTLGSAATKLDDEDTPMRQLTIRSFESQDRIYFGNSDVQSDGTAAMGYLTSDTTQGGSYTWGPYQAGTGIRPEQIFVVGTVGQQVVWTGFPA